MKTVMNSVIYQIKLRMDINTLIEVMKLVKDVIQDAAIIGIRMLIIIMKTHVILIIIGNAEIQLNISYIIRNIRINVYLTVDNILLILMVLMYMFVAISILNVHNKDNITSKLMKQQCYVINHVQQVMNLMDYIISLKKKTFV